MQKIASDLLVIKELHKT